MPQRPTHVVIAEPDASTREQLATLVTEVATELQVTVTVHQTSTGTSAFAACSEHRPTLLVAEVLLEGLSGLTLMRRIAVESKANTVVVFVTDMAREHDRFWALRSGAFAYLTKPYDEAALRSKVARALRDGPQARAESPARL